jgi:hypothetical protein
MTLVRGSEAVAPPFAPLLAPFQSRILEHHSADKFKDKTFSECRSILRAVKHEERSQNRLRYTVRPL